MAFARFQNRSSEQRQCSGMIRIQSQHLTESRFGLIEGTDSEQLEKRAASIASRPHDHAGRSRFIHQRLSDSQEILRDLDATRLAAVSAICFPEREPECAATE